MSKGWKVLVFVVAMAVITGFVPALMGQTAAAEECGAAAVKKYVDKASAILSAKGEAGFDEIKNLRFCNGQGYIYVTDINGLMLLHPIKPHLQGKSIAAIKDPKGKMFFGEMIEKCKTSGAGWVHYLWPKPGEKKPADKCGYGKKVTAGGKDYIVASGLYDVTEAKCGE